MWERPQMFECFLLMMTAGSDTVWIRTRLSVVMPQALRCSSTLDHCTTREPDMTAMMVWGPDWEYSNDTGVNIPILTIIAMGSLVTTEIQDTHLMSHLKEGTLHRVMSPITDLGHSNIFRPEEKVPPTGPPTPLPAASDLPLRDQPCLASEARKQWYAGWHAHRDRQIND